MSIVSTSRHPARLVSRAAVLQGPVGADRLFNTVIAGVLGLGWVLVQLCSVTIGGRESLSRQPADKNPPSQLRPPGGGRQ